jgi:hypothetical protein
MPGTSRHLVRGVHVGTRLDQRLNDSFVTIVGRNVEGRPTILQRYTKARNSLLASVISVVHALNLLSYR